MNERHSKIIENLFERLTNKYVDFKREEDGETLRLASKYSKIREEYGKSEFDVRAGQLRSLGISERSFIESFEQIEAFCVTFREQHCYTRNHMFSTSEIVDLICAVANEEALNKFEAIFVERFCVIREVT
jgi:hypothetical protein